MRIRTSRYLRNLRGDEDDFSLPNIRLSLPAAADSERTIIYHSLFGNARVVSPSIQSLIERCREPTDLEDVLRDYPGGTVDDLLQLQYLIPDATDESERIDMLLAERPTRLERGELFSALQLVLTNSCNFSCDYCFAYTFEDNVHERLEAGERMPAKGVLKREESSAGGDHPRRVIPIQAGSAAIHMSIDVAEAAIENAIRTRVDNGGDLLSISLFGGEPTLNRSLILHVLRKYGRGEAHGLRIDWDITTNGSRLDPELLAALAEYQVDTAVSVDYINEVTGQYRSGSRQSVPWPVISKHILELRTAGVPVHLTSVLSAQTWDHWGHVLIDWAAAAAIDEINVIVSFDGKFLETHSPAAVAERLYNAFLYGRQRNVLLSGYWYQTYSLIVNQQKYAKQADYKTCPAIGRMLSIEPNGSIFTCKATTKRVGDVTSWADTFASAGYQTYGMRAYRNGPECAGCELEGTCSGGSTGSLEATHGDIEKMHPGYCAYMRHITNRLLGENLRANSQAASEV